MNGKNRMELDEIQDSYKDIYKEAFNEKTQSIILKNSKTTLKSKIKKLWGGIAFLIVLFLLIGGYFVIRTPGKIKITAELKEINILKTKLRNQDVKIIELVAQVAKVNQNIIAQSIDIKGQSKILKLEFANIKQQMLLLATSPISIQQISNKEVTISQKTEKIAQVAKPAQVAKIIAKPKKSKKQIKKKSRKVLSSFDNISPEMRAEMGL